MSDVLALLFASCLLLETLALFVTIRNMVRWEQLAKTQAAIVARLLHGLELGRLAVVAQRLQVKELEAQLRQAGEAAMIYGRN